MDRGELDDHPGAAWIVERVRKLLVSVLQKLEDIQVALMMASRNIQAKGLEFFKNALTESLERQFSELAKDLPV